MVASSKCDSMCALADGSHLANVATRRHFPGPTRSRALPTPTGAAAPAAIPLLSTPPLLSPSSLHSFSHQLLPCTLYLTVAGAVAVPGPPLPTASTPLAALPLTLAVCVVGFVPSSCCILACILHQYHDVSCNHYLLTHHTLRHLRPGRRRSVRPRPASTCRPRRRPCLHHLRGESPGSHIAPKLDKSSSELAKKER